MADLPLYNIAKCQLYEVVKKAMQLMPEGTKARPDFNTQLYNTTRFTLNYTITGS